MATISDLCEMMAAVNGVCGRLKVSYAETFEYLDKFVSAFPSKISVAKDQGKRVFKRGKLIDL